jgi:hypothetical protein
MVSVSISRAKDGTLAIIVGLDGENPKIETQIPQSLNNYPVLAQIIGTIEPE